jgi:hypothetical protein
MDMKDDPVAIALKELVTSKESTVRVLERMQESVRPSGGQTASWFTSSSVQNSTPTESKVCIEAKADKNEFVLKSILKSLRQPQEMDEPAFLTSLCGFLKKNQRLYYYNWTKPEAVDIEKERQVEFYVDGTNAFKDLTDVDLAIYNRTYVEHLVGQQEEEFSDMYNKWKRTFNSTYNDPLNEGKEVRVPLEDILDDLKFKRRDVYPDIDYWFILNDGLKTTTPRNLEDKSFVEPYLNKLKMLVLDDHENKWHKELEGHFDVVHIDNIVDNTFDFFRYDALQFSHNTTPRCPPNQKPKTLSTLYFLSPLFTPCFALHRLRLNFENPSVAMWLSVSFNHIDRIDRLFHPIPKKSTNNEHIEKLKGVLTSHSKSFKRTLYIDTGRLRQPDAKAGKADSSDASNGSQVNQSKKDSGSQVNQSREDSADSTFQASRPSNDDEDDLRFSTMWRALSTVVRELTQKNASN